MIIVERVRIFTRPLTSTVLCMSFRRSAETPAVSPRCPNSMPFEPCWGGRWRARVLRRQPGELQGARSPRSTEPPRCQSWRFRKGIILDCSSFCAFRGVFWMPALSILCKFRLLHHHKNIKIVMTQYVAPKQSNTSRFWAGGPEKHTQIGTEQALETSWSGTKHL